MLCTRQQPRELRHDLLGDSQLRIELLHQAANVIVNFSSRRATIHARFSRQTGLTVLFIQNPNRNTAGAVDSVDAYLEAEVQMPTGPKVRMCCVPWCPMPARTQRQRCEKNW